MHGNTRRDRRLPRNQQPQNVIEVVAQPGRRDHRVQQAVREQVLRALHPARQAFAVQGGVHLGPEKPDEGVRLGGGDVTEGSPRRHDTTRCGVTQVDHERQSGRPVGDDRCGQWNHLQEGQSALLHAGASRGGHRQQWQPTGGGAANRGRQASGGRDAHRSTQESEIERDDRHRQPAQAHGSRHGRLVETSSRARRDELVGIPRVGLQHLLWRLCPSVVPWPEGSRIGDRLQERNY